MTTNGDRITPPHGLPARELLEKHDSDIKGLTGVVRAVVNEVGDLRLEVAEVKGIAMRLESRSVTIPPPMRAELPSSVDPRELKAELRQAAREGEKDPSTTAEARVEAVLERVELIRRGRLFNKVLWLALSGAAGLGVDEVIRLLTHH